MSVDYDEGQESPSVAILYSTGLGKHIRGFATAVAG